MLMTFRGFKALKQMTKMNYLFLHHPEEALSTYRELLGYTKVRAYLASHEPCCLVFGVLPAHLLNRAM
jgi:hypothetical protein